MTSLSSYSLSDRYTALDGTVFLTGIQALARIPIDQLRADRRAGHRTAAFVSGYPGSPLGGLDSAIDAAAKLAKDLPIEHRRGLNEEYAATAVMGSQLAAAQHDARYDGVIGIWYGKAPGVDRASDALRHAGYTGVAPLSGAVAIVGDDPQAKSSTVPSSSAGVLADLHMPMLYPANPAEVLDLGRHAVAMSRGTGLWSALKIVADVADGTASVDLDPDRVNPVFPTIDGERYQGRPEGQLLTPLTVDIEREIYEVRYKLAIEYASSNRLNYVAIDSPDAWIGIVASGITSEEVREALARLGLVTNAEIASSGIRILRMQMPIPFDPATIRNFARGLDELFVIEEKAPNIELLVKDALYSLAERPVVVGKTDESGQTLIQGYAGLDADTIVPALRKRLSSRVGDRLVPEPPPPRERIPVAVDRTPFYCSGCPHNRSTQVPDGAMVAAGIGCHTMTLLMDPDRVGEISGITCMGNEGTQWIGMAPFIERDHLIQNLGDGTFFHSGQLAITASIAAGINITYKLLYNGAVAMTGGQLPQGQLPVEAITANLLRQGAAKVLVTTDDTAKYKAIELPDGVDVWDRDRLIEAQQYLATVAGVTILIHDQACAAELRRARKRGLAPTPTQRIVINHRICEGCGDCGQVSNCLSVEPFETEWGRKTKINQTTCNLDYSCLEGDCPSFMTVETNPSRFAKLLDRRSSSAKSPAATSGIDVLVDRDFPEPSLIVPGDDFTMRITGVGGTGVVTIAQILGTAAMLNGFEVRGLDQIGLSQKAGPVVSDLRLSRTHPGFTNRLGSEQANLILAFDQLVAASDRGLLTADPKRTVVVGSSSSTPTGSMITHPEIGLPSLDQLDETIGSVTTDKRFWADAQRITAAAFGDSVSANIYVVGMAVQAGALPIDASALEEAIALNGVAIERNKAAFRLGRLSIVDPTAVDALLPDSRHPDAQLPARLTQRVEAMGLDRNAQQALVRLAADLIDYQDDDYAADFLDEVAKVAARETAVAGAPGALTAAVAVQLHKLLAYKDEYEVARLMADPGGRAEAEHVAGGKAQISYRLHPPMLKALGLDSKISFGPPTEPMFRALAKGKRLRGTMADPFRWAEVRKQERRLPGEYRADIATIIASLTVDNIEHAVEIASLPDQIRGYEDLKLRRIGEYRTAMSSALKQFKSIK